MIIGDRLRALRELKKFSQGEIEQRTGLLRCYISRVENNHTVPAVETLEKFARALEVPLYQLFFEGETPSKAPEIKTPPVATPEFARGASGRDARLMARFQRLFSRMDESKRLLVLDMARKLAMQRGKTMPARKNKKARAGS